MDKSWMTIRRNRLASREYILGVESFLQFAMANLGPQPEIRCPCNDCLNGRKHSFEVVKIHLIRKGFDSSYKTWVHHGEFVPAPQAYDDDHHHPNEGIGDETGGEVPRDGNPLQNMLEQVFVGGLLDDDSDELPANLGRGNGRSFDKLFNAAQRKIYPGCEKTVLAFIVEMLHVKVYKKMPNDTFHIVMNIIKGMRSDYDEAIPWNTYEAKKFLRDLGLGYVPIHACINDCALFWKEPNSNESSVGTKKLDLCDLFEASHRLRDTNEWINSSCQEKHEMMVAIRDEAAQSGTPLSAEELSIKCLGESKTKNYIRGLGNGPKPSTYLSKSNSQSARQDQLQKLQHELDLIREEQRREREEEKTRREEEKTQREEEQRQHEEEQRRREEKYEEEQRRREEKYDEEKRRWEETQRRQDEERSILLKEMEVFKSFMTQMQNGGRGNMGAR